MITIPIIHSSQSDLVQIFFLFYCLIKYIKKEESQAIGKGVNYLNTSSSFPSSQALTLTSAEEVLRPDDLNVALRIFHY